MPEPSTSALPRLVSVRQLAEIIGRSTQAVYAMRHRGLTPPAVHIGGALRWRIEDVEQWIADNLEASR